MSPAALAVAAVPEVADAQVRNDNAAVEIAPGLAASITPERLERAARALARRFVDLAVMEVEGTTNENR